MKRFFKWIEDTYHTQMILAMYVEVAAVVGIFVLELLTWLGVKP